ncbi:hypothetical protein JL720_4711 [Aureococcus anophagefferens]|nr:hypothetical protein JL720_4711 [Aureococcus anophagefferens]
MVAALCAAPSDEDGGGGARLSTTARDDGARPLRGPLQQQHPEDFAIDATPPRSSWTATGGEAPALAPGTEATTLASGLRVVSQETFTYMSAMGLVVGAGSAHERAALGTAGGAQLAEVCAWRGTTKRSTADVPAAAERSGAYLHANAQREQTLYCVDALRDNAVAAGELLAEAALLGPDLSSAEDLDAAKTSLLLAWEDAPQDARVRELIHEAAYGRTSPLGAPLLTPPDEVAKLDALTLANFRSTLFGPDRMVLAGAGIDHATLVGIAETYFEPFVPPRGPAPPAAPSPYTLLGGGDSFSAGGPGKGMYSRLYREVLNRHYWVEGAECFVSVHDAEGLLGIMGAAPAAYAGHLTEVLAAHLLRVGAEPVKRDELDRAKNMLKVNVLTQLESRLVLFEDLGRQYATFGKRQTLREMTDLVDAVTEEDILRIGATMLSRPPSIAAHGEDLSKVPAFDTIKQWRLK